MTKLDWQLTKTAMDCLQKYDHIVNGRLVPKPRQPTDPVANKDYAMLFGSAYHQVMEDKLIQDSKSSLGIKICLGAGEEYIQQLLPHKKFDKGGYIRDKLGTLSSSYLSVYAEFFQNHEIISKEKCLNSTHGEYCCKCDMVVRNTQTGLYYIVEFKTGKDILSIFAQDHYMRVNPQVSGQLYCGRCTYGDKFGGVIVQHVCISKNIHTDLFIPYNDNRVFYHSHHVVQGVLRDIKANTKRRQYHNCWNCKYYEKCTRGWNDGLVKGTWVPGVGYEYDKE